MTRSLTRDAPALVAILFAALLVAGGAAAEPASLSRKQAEAQQVLAQIHEIDLEVARAAEAYNLANIQLEQIAREQRANERMLVLARRNLGAAQTALEERLVAIYTSGGSAGSALEVILGARSLDDVLDRLETADRVSALDARVLEQVSAFRAQVQRQRTKLAQARAAQQRVVAARAAHRADVERRLGERRRLLATIREEIERIRAADRRRQLALVRQARARLGVQRQPNAQAAAALPADEAAPAAEAPAGEAPAARYGGVVGIAMQYLGVPYRWGGASPSTGFDCSGLTMYVYAQVGVSLPHNAAMQYQLGTPVSRDQLQPGDLVFFHGLGHMGLYIGGGQFIHAPQTGDVVKISPLAGWYSSRYVGARRL